MSPTVRRDGAAEQGRRPIGQVLKDLGLVREGQVQEALAEQRKHGGLIGQHLVALGHCKQADIAAALAVQSGLATVDLESVRPSAEALERIDASTAHAYGVLPIEIAGDTLTVALGDPLNTAILEPSPTPTESPGDAGDRPGKDDPKDDDRRSPTASPTTSPSSHDDSGTSGTSGTSGGGGSDDDHSGSDDDHEPDDD